MSEFDVSISDTSDQFNNLVMTVVRRLDESESRQLRRALEKAWDAGYDSCRMEINLQADDPTYPIHRRNPWREST